MIKALLGITKEPFNHTDLPLLAQQKHIVDLVKIHAQQGGFSVIIGQPGVGKSIVREHLESFASERDTIVASFSRTLHTYAHCLNQLADSLQLSVAANQLEKKLIQTAFDHVRQRKTLYTVIDEAHLLDMTVLRKLRLLFDQFPAKHNLVLFGQPELLYYLSLLSNADIKGRITFSHTLVPLANEAMVDAINDQLKAVGLGANTFNDDALELIVRCVEGNLRLGRNLCYASLIEACRAGKKIVTTGHVNAVLIQPHWRSHDQLIKQQTA